MCRNRWRCRFPGLVAMQTPVLQWSRVSRFRRVGGACEQRRIAGSHVIRGLKGSRAQGVDRVKVSAIRDGDISLLANGHKWTTPWEEYPNMLFNKWAMLYVHKQLTDLKLPNQCSRNKCGCSSIDVHRRHYRPGSWQTRSKMCPPKLLIVHCSATAPLLSVRTVWILYGNDCTL